MKRFQNTRQVHAGAVPIGGGAPVTVQSMTNVDTKDLEALGVQIRALEDAGCDIVRVALYDRACAELVPEILRSARIPVVGDVHFDYEIAVLAAENGISKIRVNPGNIGGPAGVRRVADAAKAAGIPIRVGANSGSLPSKAPSDDQAGALVRAALDQVRILEANDFHDIVVSLKSSSVPVSVAAARRFSELSDYPLHLGITEAGTERRALLKSAAGIGSLLLDGIGDTVRVSISGDPVREVRAARDILAACGLRPDESQVISCPTCARCGIDVEALSQAVEDRILPSLGRPLTIAVMGCAVNGPGEARHADVGIAGAPAGAVLFRDGQVVGRTSRENALEALTALIAEMQEV